LATFLGIGTTCAEANCSGACCGTAAGCLESRVFEDLLGSSLIGLDATTCNLLGGQWAGLGTTCAADCPPPVEGACCVPTNFQNFFQDVGLSIPGSGQTINIETDLPDAVCWDLATFEGLFDGFTPDMDYLCAEAGGEFQGVGTTCATTEACDRTNITCPPDVQIYPCDSIDPANTGMGTSTLE
jgi:hypothetical protein